MINIFENHHPNKSLIRLDRMVEQISQERHLNWDPKDFKIKRNDFNVK